MGRRKRSKRRQAVQLQTDRLEPKGGSGLDGEGRRWTVKGAGVGDLVSAFPQRKGKARLVEILTPAEGSIAPPCPLFGSCGGCQLQTMELGKQRRAKMEMVSRLVAPFEGRVHPIRGAADGYGYRNKLELSFGRRRFFPEAEKDAVADAQEGSFLGMHPRGWHSKIVPVPECRLASPGMNEAIRRLQELPLEPAWDGRNHSGKWRHAVIREGGGILVSMVTSSEADEEDLQRVADRLADLPGLRGVLWVVTDNLAEVAQGELRKVLIGSQELEMVLAGKRMKIPHDAFFQVSPQGAELLAGVLAEAAPAGGTLLDLYCGVGAMGIALSGGFERVVGIELHEAATATARRNAEASGVRGEWHAGKVEEILPRLSWDGPATILVDPPRAGLHPKAAAFLARQRAECLLYVACNPASLARDRVVLEEGGWRMTDLWTVDIFPQTPHVEAVGKFVMEGGQEAC